MIMRTADQTLELKLPKAKQAGSIRLFSGVATVVNTVMRALSNRIRTNDLAELDDHQLADIGLTRNDVLKALDAGLLEDPTMHLARAAQLRARDRFKPVLSN
jgi:uncharacterized protein YjiS (DUF1127 family)